MGRSIGNNTWTRDETPEMKEARGTIDRKCSSKCPNCQHPAFFGVMGKGTNIEVKCASCKRFYYERVL